MTFTGLWRSEGFNALYRLVRQALNGKLKGRPNKADLPCFFAFVYTRILAFTKEPWKSQLNYITAADALQSFEAVRRSERETFFAFKLLHNMPLHVLVAEPYWGPLILGRLVRHRRKFRNYLAPDALPFPMESQFPIMDVGMSAEEWGTADF
eukprot:TRINITY_DN63616_c0_g1_i1.p1 TRINITY_DN63616_c0_g1~~TRINITY_DN63616_c0_g1_i1.p1  ORF type:complete len:152 (-),score=32.63 TRINITY_DN63616_c0_g1_i1:378-833(-)